MKRISILVILLLVPVFLRVGRKPSMKCKEWVVLLQNEQDPSRYEFWWEKSEVYGHFILDEDGRIKEIGCWFNAC